MTQNTGFILNILNIRRDIDSSLAEFMTLPRVQHKSNNININTPINFNYSNDTRIEVSSTGSYISIFRNNNTSESTEIKTFDSPQFITYIVKKDDTLSKIAKIYGTTADEIAKLNNFKNKDVIIQTGQELQIPIRNNKARDLVQTNNEAKIEPTTIPAVKSTNTNKSENSEPVTLTQRDFNIIKNAKPKIKEHEKFMPFVYVCAGGAETIGYGHKIQNKENRFKNIKRIYNKKEKNEIMFNEKYRQAMMKKYKNHITENKAEKILDEDIKREYLKMKKALGSDVMNMLTDKQIEALTSLTFNRPICEKNTPLLIKYLKAATQAKDEKEKERLLFKAQAEMNIFGAGKTTKQTCAGLIRRRISEMSDFMNGVICEEAKTKILDAINQCKTISKGYKFKSLNEVIDSKIVQDTELKELLKNIL